MAKSKEYMALYRAKKPVDPSGLSEQRDEYGNLAGLVDSEGRISLDVVAYAGHSRRELEDFFSQMPYESTRGYDSQGNLVYIVSQFSENSTTSNVREMVEAGAADMTHNHPIQPDTTFPLFSGGAKSDPGDVNNLGIVFGVFSMSSYSAQTSEGHVFTLRNNGCSTADANRFARAYGMAMKRGYSAVAPTLSNREFLTRMTTYMDTWLKASAPKYNMSYESNWTGER